MPVSLGSVSCPFNWRLEFENQKGLVRKTGTRYFLLFVYIKIPPPSKMYGGISKLLGESPITPPRINTEWVGCPLLSCLFVYVGVSLRVFQSYCDGTHMRLIHVVLPHWSAPFTVALQEHPTQSHNQLTHCTPVIFPRARLLMQSDSA